MELSFLAINQVSAKPPRVRASPSFSTFMEDPWGRALALLGLEIQSIIVEVVCTEWSGLLLWLAEVECVQSCWSTLKVVWTATALCICPADGRHALAFEPGSSTVDVNRSKVKEELQMVGEQGI